MASEILGLFTSPEQYQAQQNQQIQNQAIQYAGMSPFQRADVSLYTGGRQLGQAVGSLFGMEDPQLKKITMRQQMLTGAGGAPRINLNDPGSMLRAANIAQEQGDPEFAQYLINAGNDLAKNMAEMRSKSATAAKTELGIAQEEKLRDELSNLGPTPTNEQVLAVVSKYGSPEKIMGVLQATQTAQATREARKEETTAKIESKKEDLQTKIAADAQARQEAYDRQLALARENNASRADQAKLQREFVANENRQKAEDRKALADLAAASKPLPAGIQKAEDADYDAAQSAINLAKDADKYLTSIKSGNIKFGLKDRISITARSALGSNDPDVVARNDFERFKTTIVNESLRLNKGTQTEGDAIRAAKELQGAESAADAGKAIQTLRDLNARRAGDYKSSIERRRANSKLPMPEMIFESPKFEPHVFTNADYAALPKGAVFIDDKGVRRKKP
jgi:hypothetical protein